MHSDEDKEKKRSLTTCNIFTYFYAEFRVTDS